MQTIDYKGQLKKLYRATTSDVELVDVQPMNFLLIDGQGPHDASQEYQDAVDALLAAANALKALIKRTESIDYAVMPLEALWGSEAAGRFSLDRKADGKWSLMIHQPTPVTRKLYEKAMADVKAKTPLAALAKLRFESLHEGRAAQRLHVGPLGDAGPAVQALHDRIHAIGAKIAGRHHEIYLSDMRKAAPDKMRTLFRQPYV